MESIFFLCFYGEKDTSQSVNSTVCYFLWKPQASALAGGKFMELPWIYKILICKRKERKGKAKRNIHMDRFGVLLFDNDIAAPRLLFSENLSVFVEENSFSEKGTNP